MATAISIALTVRDVDAHFVLSFADPLFHLRDIERHTETELNAVSLVGRLTGYFDAPGSAFVALIDHDGAALDLGFVAQRRNGEWTDITAPQHPRPISWHDVESELWATLTRLTTSAPMSAASAA